MTTFYALLNVLETTKLDKHFTIYDNEANIVGWFAHWMDADGDKEMDLIDYAINENYITDLSPEAILDNTTFVEFTQQDWFYR